jgi:polysaccharide export outer membrane protein
MVPEAGSPAQAGAAVRMVTPSEGSSYSAGELIPLVADVSGSSDLTQDWSFQWEVSLIRNGREEVARMTAAGRRTSFVAQEESDRPALSYRVRLVAADPLGVGDTVEVRLFPRSSFENERAIHSGDILQVSFYAGGEKQEDFAAQVSSAGYLNSPLIGEVHVSGLTPFKVAEAMRSQLAERFYVNPQVLVSLKELGGKVYVSGEVSRPGAYELQEGLTVLRLCALAGGFTNYAALNAVKITRYDRAGATTFKLDLGKVRNGKQEDVVLKNGDQVDVPHRRF